jgi:diguanylate cyclase (GGDEF)-like protein
MTLIRKINTAPSDKLTRYISLPCLRGLYGLVLSTASPLGWIIIQFIAGRDPFSEKYFDPLLYYYMSIATAIVFFVLGYAIGKREVMITELALTDGLTSLYNKRYFSNRLKQEFNRYLRQKSDIALIQIDIDFFKGINDNYGHHIGDEVLKAIAKIIRENCRINEIAARVGGEELSIIAYDCQEEAAYKLAERIRQKIQEFDFSSLGIPIPVTASFGVAVADASTKKDSDLYKNADEALYVAKKSGRNRVCLFSEIVDNFEP